MTTRNAILRTAQSQLGYTERGSNLTKYWADLKPSFQGAPWCAAFTAWVYRQNGSDLLLTGPSAPFYTPSMEAWARATGRWKMSKDCQPGDVLIFGPASGAVHTGILERQDGPDHVVSIEGNGLPLDTPVLTGSGWKAIGAVRVGDTMVDPQGHISRVKGVFPQGVRPCYKLTLTDGREIVADENHRWTVQRPSSASQWVVKTTGELLASRSRWRLPRVEVLPELDGTTDAELPMPAWLVGAFIGDGCLTYGATLAASNAEMVQKAYALAGAPSRVNVKDNSRYGYAEGRTHTFPQMVGPLRELGLLGRTWDEKTIPAAYMTAGVEARKALLAGLLDTDGTCDTFGRASFATGSHGLVLQVQELIRSLGGTCGITVHRPSYTHLGSGEKREGSVGYRCSNIRLPFNPFTRSDKAERFTSMSDRRTVRGWGVRSIEPVESQETVCISVTAPSETYIADGWIVTHNTSPGSGGSQTNGGGVYRRRRPRSWVRGCISMTSAITSTDSLGGGQTAPIPTAPSRLDEDGVLGPATLRALERYLQRPQDGTLDRMTVRALQTWVGRGRTGKLSADDIRALQRKVGAVVDGVWGPNTTLGLQRFLNRRNGHA